jgi:uncharacterized membrane protein
MMGQVASLSIGGAVVALAAGAAGAQSLVQSERTSLVTATAAGFLVAAALSPTAAVLGLAVPLGRWDYAAAMAFQLALQFAALAVGGWLILAVFGVRAADSSAGRGSRAVRWGAGAALAVAVAALVTVQALTSPALLRADLSRRAEAAGRAAVAGVPGADLVEVEARFARASRREADVLLVVVRVEAAPDAAADPALRERLRAAVHGEASALDPGIVPVVDVTVLSAPPP